MSNTANANAAPDSQRHGPDGIEIVFAVLAILLLLPVIVVGTITTAVLRRRGSRFAAGAVGLGVVGLGVIALTVGAHAAGVAYAAPLSRSYGGFDD